MTENVRRTLKFVARKRKGEKGVISRIERRRALQGRKVSEKRREKLQRKKDCLRMTILQADKKTDTKRELLIQGPEKRHR